MCLQPHKIKEFSTQQVTNHILSLIIYRCQVWDDDHSVSMLLLCLSKTCIFNNILQVTFLCNFHIQKGCSHLCLIRKIISFVCNMRHAYEDVGT